MSEKYRNGSNASGQRSLGRQVDGGSSAEIFRPSVALSEFVVPCTYRDGVPVSYLGGHVMRLSSSFVAPSAITIVSTALLCGLSGTAVSQTAIRSATPLPGITVNAPKQVARPHRPERVESRPTWSTAHRRTAPTSPASSEAIIAGPGSTLGKLAKLESISSNCNGGCQTSGKTGKEAWIGCSESAGYWSTFSATCTDTLSYASYVGCMDVKMFTGWERNRAWWYCTSLSAGNKFKVAELKRSRR
jgi:hypothetical protein